MQTRSHQINNKLFLVSTSKTAQTVQPTVMVSKPVHHISIVDCSGSMSGDLPQIREQLKRKLPKLLKAEDTISIIWFSGRGEFGCLLKAEPVASLTDLKDVNQAIDRWLRPVGLTGFKEPLEEAARVVDELSNKTPNHSYNLMFLSDGCDNSWGRDLVLKSLDKLKGRVNATFVEYGFYADRPLLTAMAEKCGGALIFAQDFDRYVPLMDASFQKNFTGSKRIEYPVKGDPIGGFAFAMSQGDLLTFAVEGGKVQVPENIEEVWYLSPSSDGQSGESLEDCVVKTKTPALLSAAYAAVSLYAVRMKSDVVYPLLKVLGDVSFIESFSSCFGKQRYSAFMDMAKEASFDPTKRLSKGYDPNKVPRDDAFTVLDLLKILAEDENFLLLDDPAFKYNKISRGRVDANTVLTDEELAEVQKLTSEISHEKSVTKLKELQTRLASLTNKKSLSFEKTVSDKGYPISSLTYSESRPNVSILVEIEGTVDLSEVLSADQKKVIPEKFPTFQYRNFAIIKDGLVNVSKLPVNVTPETYKRLIEAGMVTTPTYTPKVVLDIEHLPVINRNMIKATSAKTLFEKEWSLLKAQADQKVFNSIKKEKFPKLSQGYEVIYGKENTSWLKEQGFTEYSGFAPKSVQAESKDFYLGKELKVSLKGYSKLPSLKEARESVAKKKVSAATNLMVSAINEVDNYLCSQEYKEKGDNAFEAWLVAKAVDATSRTRTLLRELAHIKFAVIVGQVWFTEFATPEENSMALTLDGVKVDAKVEMCDVEVKI